MPHTESTHEVATPRTDVTVCLTAIQEFVGKRWNDDVRLEILTVSLLPQVECDPTAFRDAVLQLLSNAREAMPDGGSIAVTVLIARLQPTMLVEVRVRDNGIGMSRDTLNHAFDPYFTTKSRGLGGMGLPSVRRFAEDHGGDIKIRSVPGRGTIVALRVPGVPAPNGKDPSLLTLSLKCIGSVGG